MTHDDPDVYRCVLLLSLFTRYRHVRYARYVSNLLPVITREKGADYFPRDRFASILITEKDEIR